MIKYKNMKKFNEIFNFARENVFSDLHIIENENIYARIFGKLIELKNSIKFTNEELKEFCLDKIEADFSYTDDLGRRYRINSFITRSKLALVVRIIREKPINLKEKFINQIIEEKILNLKSGLILVTGATGSGKSNTLANIIERFNERKNYKILTIEDPIEYLFKSKRSLIIQREINSDVKSFEIALKSSLRQDPNIIMVGEIRDEESLYAVLKLSETGHLVLSTLHTIDTVETINRIISMASSDKRDYIRSQLSTVLRFIFSQELLIDEKKEKIYPIFEILNNTKAVSNLIASDKLNQISNLIESGIENYMITKERYKKMLNIVEEKVENRV